MLGIRRTVLATVTCGVLLALMLPAVGGAAGKPANACPPGFDLGMLTIEQAADLPRSQAAVEDGLVDRAGLIATYTGFDRNGDGYICGQLPYGFEVGNRPFGAYYYNFADDNSSVR